MKYLLIDGNHMACRATFAHSELKSNTGVPTGVHFGFFNNIINLKQQYPDYNFLISWDGKSGRRKVESKVGVDKGIVKSAYKENRDTAEEMPQPMKDFISQAPFLKKALGETGIPQIRMPDFETDDIIFSYCKKIGENNEIICVTGDEDYFQLLSDNVSIWNDGKKKHITKTDWVKEYEITPEQWVDVGSLTGDTGDNIFGVYGVGEVTALKLIREYGTYEKTLQALHSQLDPLRLQYPDLTDANELKRLAEMKTDPDNPKSKLKYPEITLGTPFTGVALALEDKKIKKITKANLMILMFEERVKLAYSLKKMDIVPNLPDIIQGTPNKQRLIEYCDYYDMVSLKISIESLM